MLMPTTPEEIKHLGWNQLDIILVTGDSYIDSPFIGITVIGKVLAHAGYRVELLVNRILILREISAGWESRDYSGVFPGVVLTRW